MLNKIEYMPAFNTGKTHTILIADEFRAATIKGLEKLGYWIIIAYIDNEPVTVIPSHTTDLVGA